VVGFVFSVWFLLVESEGSFAGFQGFGDLDEDAGNEPQERFLAREESDDPRAFLDLAVDVLAGVGGPQTLPAGFGQCEDGEALRVAVLGPGGELGLAFNGGFYEILEMFFGVGTVGGGCKSSSVIGLHS